MKRKTLAIPIRVVNWSDTSQVVLLFTRGHGVVEAIAKGAHRVPNPFQGPFDIAVVWEVVYAERPPERGLSILTEGAVVEGFRGTRRTWGRWAAAAYVVEYLRAVGTAGEPADELFDAAARTLDGIAGAGWPAGDALGAAAGEGARLAAWLIAFECRALRILGLSAPATACAGCGRPWSGSDRPVLFSGEAGGILCGACRRDHRGVVVGGRAVRALEALASGREAAAPGEAGPGRLPAAAAVRGAAAGIAVAGGAGGPPALLADMARVVGDLRVFLLEHQFRMLKFLPL